MSFFRPLTGVLAVLLLLNISCQKEETLRNGGFTAKVNGKRWRAKSNDFKKGPYEARFLSDSALAISASGPASYMSLFISLDHRVVPGQYVLNHDQPYIPGGEYVDYNTMIRYRTSSIHTGKLVIKELNRETHKITGTFYFDAKSEESGETVKISDGAFNISFDNF